MSGRFRPRRVADQIRAVLAELVQQQVKDPGLGFVTITEVRMSGDLHYATVFVSVMGDTASEDVSISTLRRAAPFLRSEVGRRVSLRHTPELRFELDQTLAHSDRIEKLLRDGHESKGQEGDQNERD
ncbi:MAG: 30S ribosome-binding factor RbfA [Acidobacteria bacterium]|nr:30S ribosome-binding factor RbfA [Acidobacteriota bacterium]